MMDDPHSTAHDEEATTTPISADSLLQGLDGLAQHIRTLLLSSSWPGQPEALNYRHMEDLQKRLQATERMLRAWLEANRSQ